MDSKKDSTSPSNLFDFYEDVSSDGMQDFASTSGMLEHVYTEHPPVAVKEKIVFIIDNSEDAGIGYSCLDLDKSDEETKAPYIVRNEVLRVFMTNKLALAKDTVFGMISVEPGKIKWISTLSSDIKLLTKSLNKLDGSFHEDVIDFDFTSVFSSVLSRIQLPQQLTSVVPPDYLIRIILVYCNSQQELKLDTADSAYNKFITSPYCILDVFYLHEEQSEYNRVKEIFESFTKITSPRSYLLESSRNVRNVFNNMAKLLAHPFQRVEQSSWEF